MDVVEKLKLHMGFIVGVVFARVGNDEDEFLKEMYKMIECDIGINFDSEHFYLMDYKKVQDNLIYFDINSPHTPRDLLVVTRDLVKHSRMKENIKNKKYLIHFRDFKDEVYMEDKENTLRVEAFLRMHQFVRNVMKIRIFLINKLVEIRNSIKNPSDDDDPSDCQRELIRRKIQRFRVETILKAIEANTVHVH